MKEIVIISCWPNNEYREKLLVNLIQKLKKLNKEILIASHYVVPDYIVKMVDYCIYDKTNTIYTNKTLNTYSFDYYFECDLFRVEAVNIAHSCALSRIFNIALNFVKNLEYDYFTIIESDVEFGGNDLEKLDNIKSRLINESKKLYFFRIKPYEFPYWEDNGMFEVYETFCFGGFVDEFLSKLNFPKTLNEWNEILLKDKNNHNFEYVVTEAFKPFKDKYLILDSSKYFFSQSKINTSTVLGLDGVYCNPKNNNSPTLFLYNESEKTRIYEISSSIWEPSETEQIILDPDTWWYVAFNTDEHGKYIKIDVYEENNLVNSSNILINKSWVDLQKNRRQIIPK
jgi:hypothetical protein